MSLFPSVFQEYVPPQIANHITSRLCYLMTPVVNADLKLTRFSGSCRFKTDTPLSH